jgi:hypothetical protein
MTTNIEQMVFIFQLGWAIGGTIAFVGYGIYLICKYFNRK